MKLTNEHIIPQIEKDSPIGSDGWEVKVVDNNGRAHGL